MRVFMTVSLRVQTQRPRSGSARARIEAFLNARWYGQAGILHLLQPMAWLYTAIAAWRRSRAQQTAGKKQDNRLPTIVVGNLVTGGTGKTPVVAMLVEELKALGANPGIVARGYGGASRNWPLLVTVDLDPKLCGDEALELAQATGCPVVAGPDRSACVQQLATRHDCDVVVSDDGLQHYAMSRDLEVVLVDAHRQFGNGHQLPVGPLREPIERLREAQLMLVTARTLEEAQASRPLLVEQAGVPESAALGCALEAYTAQALLEDASVGLAEAPFVGEHCVALSGIGAPERFHQDLESLGCSVDPHVLADHQDYSELISAGELKNWAMLNWVVTTGKDAVKLRFQLNPNKVDSVAVRDDPVWKRVWVLNRRVVFSDTDLAELRRVLTEFAEQWQLGAVKTNGSKKAQEHS